MSVVLLQREWEIWKCYLYLEKNNFFCQHRTGSIRKTGKDKQMQTFQEVGKLGRNLEQKPWPQACLLAHTQLTFFNNARLMFQEHCYPQWVVHYHVNQETLVSHWHDLRPIWLSQLSNWGSLFLGDSTVVSSWEQKWTNMVILLYWHCPLKWSCSTLRC